ncbi:uncharacterized protein LOC125235526 [Leguminivora glycinivorella]|uniref:uncharacterized protein LOC125235526 n=1 Tax=Leguminivora glycinivorella TaxID=1035111 RepID=UPI00200CAB03|nr:uncharacterized protein LOC125235526 [Leguminivora glycinivorella]XP_047998064.1 uncharacterized protein LOC125235526 [Leguminivora glycinivorella]XP_047998065.1 uncharacterized protein LOC125235526 [Leguminivora glycinivorella]XP_047998066.1 uncharacterized protein LOC125235526 [Leguminivora glycinivorella]XP_047998067.1 uncharacterized protein LOC125235526 [Leguminivora glycinivorella]
MTNYNEMAVTNMKLPDLRMCCCCIPLKAGILTWGYINVIYHAAFAALFCIAYPYIFALALFYVDSGSRNSDTEMFFTNYVISVILLFIFTTYYVVLVVASHTNNIRTLNILFKVGVVLWIFKFLYCSVYLGYHLMAGIFRDFKHTDDSVITKRRLFLIWVMFEPVIQLYGFLLIRSFMLKLRGENHSVGYIHIVSDVELDREPLIIESTKLNVKPEPIVHVKTNKMDLSDFY